MDRCSPEFLEDADLNLVWVERDQAIEAWCRSVWNAYRESHGVIADLARSELGV